ncbi:MULTISPECIES: transglycosylase domain-containing protein [unclassified Isoptericola]|uniref:transglycosylase domain-containing protein n=1 Tax=unclassified Isoptericola TaxID=2623355 RepID=UPI002712A678|nr:MULTISPECIES: transglycosylase domain-containing protein [unclassified Isoptericola]MDO8143779.1 transglycosylase domain-containing protein [Isoptericola sp. 178]MDO8147680.1 transglycosylase domain-containing protein [Isoptericola sp. b515]MDO8150020.1 transglycosylase domain-containing protein [Isoptericola sp. b408]
MGRFWNYPRRGLGPVQRWLPSWRIVVGCVLGFVALGAGVFFAAWTSTAIPKNLDDVDHQATTVYYANGKEIGTFSSVKREIVAYEDLPKHVGDAVVASENESFWEDAGVDFFGMARAAFTNLTTGSRQGGSTLTQQYVERYYLGQTSDIAGKAREAIIAMKIAQNQPKELVLDRYLNTIYFGRGAYGVQAAAQAYFDKDAKDLTYSESAMLSGIIPAPVRYDPSENPDIAKARWERSLNRMAEQGYITQAEADSAQFPEFVEKDTSSNSLGGQKGYIMNAVKKELLATGEFTEEDLESRGLQIHTTIKPKLQRTAAKIVKDLPEDANKNIRASLVSIDPETGAIVTLYGGADYLKQSLNTATQDRVQAGSTFKPFTLIGALEDGVQLTDRFDGNTPKTFEGVGENEEGYTVNNFGEESYGEVDLVEATTHSINTAYVELNVENGPKRTVDVAHRLGIREDEDDPIAPYASNVLGTHSVYPIDMAEAYATIAGGGYHVEPYIVDRVEHMDGTQRYARETTAEKRFEPDVINAATYAMTQVVEKGSGRAALELTGPDGQRRPVAGKTGTANNNETAWFTGFTPQLATVVNLRQYKTVDVEQGIMKDKAPIEAFGPYSEITGSTWPAAAWTEFMQVALEGKEIAEFPEYTPPTPSFEPSPTPSETAEWVELPDNLVGMNINEATRLLESLGLSVATQATDDEARKGTVVNVYDTGGSVQTGSTVTLWVSTGKVEEQQKVAVPNVVGQSAGSAESQLNRVGLSTAVVEEPSNQVQRGQVIRTEPGAGSEVESGSTVTMVVSSGPQQTQEPTQEPTSEPSQSPSPTDQPGNGNGNGNG